MTTLVSKKFKQHLAEQFVESLTEPANNVYYLLASKHTPFSINDSVPLPSDSVNETNYNVFEEAIFGKKISFADVMLGIPKYTWTSNTVYPAYDPSDNDLLTKQFYVVVDSGTTYYVYKVLDNNRGAQSTVNPSGPSGSTSESACNFITTADGYTWKLMYKMPEATFEKFATPDYMPVQTSANVAGNTVAGAIDVIKISNTGSNYVATLNGQFQASDLREAIPSFSGNTTTYRLSNNASSNNSFYVDSAIYITSGSGAGQLKKIISYNGSNRIAVVNSAFSTAPDSSSVYVIAPNIVITGDGSNAVAYATVSSNSTVNNFISRVNIVSRGANYTYASASVTGNTGGISNSAIITPIIPPAGGHGFNSPEELGCDSVLLSLSFNTNESGFVTTENDYRKIILIKDPLFDKVTLSLNSEIGSFTTNEKVYQVDYVNLEGTATVNTTSSTIVGLGTNFDKGLTTGDVLLITNPTTGIKNIRTVGTVTNSTVLALNSNCSFNSSFATISYAKILAQGIKIGNNSPFITMSNVEPKFVSGKIIVGEVSSAVANVVSITVNEKSYNNWNTLDNRTRISYTASTGSMPEDAVVYQTDVILSNAYFHSSNATYVFLTSEKGPINADPSDILIQQGGSATFTLGSNKYTPDLVKNSGKVLYIENNAAISRSNSQSETIKLTVKF